MGAPSTGAKSLKCCGRAGEHQQQQQLQQQHQNAQEHHQQQQHNHQRDQENNNYPHHIIPQFDIVHNVNNNHLYLNPATVDYFTTIDETENHLNNNIRRLVTSASLSTVQTQLQSSTTAVNLDPNINQNANKSHQKKINTTGFLKFGKKANYRNTTTETKQSSIEITKEKEKPKKAKKSSGPPRAARMRPAGRCEMEDPLMQRPRRKLKSSSKQPQFTQPPPEK